MTWTKLGDDFTDDPKLLELARGVRLLHVEAIVWCNRHTTDGKIPTFALTRISDEPEPVSAAAALVDAGKWSVIDIGWEIVGFTDDQPSAEGVERIRKLAPGRVTADLFHHEILLDGVSSVNLPKIATGTIVAVQTTQNTALSQTDMTTNALTSGVVTIGGKQVVSRQLQDQSAIPFDKVILEDLSPTTRGSWVCRRSPAPVLVGS